MVPSTWPTLRWDGANFVRREFQSALHVHHPIFRWSPSKNGSWLRILGATDWRAVGCHEGIRVPRNATECFACHILAFERSAQHVTNPTQSIKRRLGSWAMGVNQSVAGRSHVSELHCGDSPILILICEGNLSSSYTNRASCSYCLFLDESWLCNSFAKCWRAGLL